MSSPTSPPTVIHFPSPVPTRPNATPPPTLNETEQTEYDLVLTHFSSPEYALPNVQSGKGTLSEEERMWLTHLESNNPPQSYECILRYLRATKHNVSRCIDALEATLKWRRDFGLYSKLTPDYLEPEASIGKMFLFGYDTCGRPAMYVVPGKLTPDGQMQLEFAFWIIERAIDLMGPGVESLTIMVDYSDSNGPGPSISTARQIVNILQTHYPERLGAALIGHLPWLIHLFFKLVLSFMDPVTREKMVFNPVIDGDGLWTSVDARNNVQADEKQPGVPAAKAFELDQLIAQGWEGTQNFVYDHALYWPALVDLCESRRKDMVRVWRELGGAIGIKEWDVKVGVQDGQSAPKVVTDSQAI
ncbi:CRAL TRIO domain-containing protein [Phlebopus sp. FC_14]|nr:CRAL TRIO domain-containing protein [Phlebopus sp. FC_14]